MIESPTRGDSKMRTRSLKRAAALPLIGKWGID
jgi:hypothetical protein